eukprot:gene12521-13805_t
MLVLMPLKPKEGRIFMITVNLPRVQRTLCVALAVSKATVIEAHTAQQKMPFAMYVVKRFIFLLSASKGLAKGVFTITSIKQDCPKEIDTISSSHKQAEISLGKAKIQALIDKSAEVNILLERKVPKNIRRIFGTSITPQPYGSSIITPKGQITLDTTWNNKTRKATWIVIDGRDLHGNPCNLISSTLAESLGRIISLNGNPN